MGACTFGATLHPSDQFMICDHGASATGCFVRCFIVPLHHAPWNFSIHEPLCNGRVDVGCRVVNAALFRSEGYRRNSEVRLTFCGNVDQQLVSTAGFTSGAQPSVVITGGLVHALQPHEAAIASRLRLAMDVADKGSGTCSQKNNDRKEAAGLRCIDGGFKHCVADALAFAPAGSVVLLLSEDGDPMHVVMERLRAKLVGVNDEQADAPHVVTILGDHIGLTSDEVEGVTECCVEAGCALMRCSLGPVTLLASQCITICHHYMDTMLHSCPNRLIEVHPEVAQMRRKNFRVVIKKHQIA